MAEFKSAYGGFSVNDLAKAKQFYTEVLGLRLLDETMGLELELPKGAKVFVYPKEDHQPAIYTTLNFVVDDIDAAMDDLTAKGISFEHYDMGSNMVQDDKGVVRGIAASMGPDIAWFKDPAGNILSVLQEK